MAIQELAGSNSSVHEATSGNSATRILLVPWDQRISIASSLAGSVHPEIPWCWCRRITIEPFSQDQIAGGGWIADPKLQAITYPNGIAKLTLEYGTDFSIAQQWPSDIPKPTFRIDTSLNLRVTSAGEFMRFPARHTRWEDNQYGDPNKPVPDEASPAGRFLVRQGEYELTWNYVDDPPVNRLRDAQGHVNDSTYLGCPSETLLFASFEAEEATQFQISHPGAWRLTLRFQLRYIKVGQSIYGWNHEYRGEDGWKKVLMYDGQAWSPRYEKTDFSNLLL